MLKTWLKILPFFIVEFIAKKKLERFKEYHMLGRVKVIVIPFKNVEFIIEEREIK
jgi:hypothetical protein